MLLGLVIILAAGLFTLWLSLTLWTAWLLTHPPRRSYAWAVSRSLPGDPGEVRLPPTAPGQPAVEHLAFSDTRIAVTTRLELSVWDMPGGDPRGPIIILSHGWGDSRVVLLSRLPAIRPLASRLLIYDSRGHGDSGGTCTLGTHEVDDLLRLIEHARESSGTDASIVLYGHSLGAGVSIAAASRDSRISAVIAEAPYRVPMTPAHNVLAGRNFPYRATLPPALAVVGARCAGSLAWSFPGNAAGFDRSLHSEKLPNATRLLIIHGLLDTICPIADARDIARAGRGQLIEIPNAGHTDLWTTPESAERAALAIRTFLGSPTANLPA